jgi:glycosyltransferase involved in cell wall biosynthesis
MRATDRPYLFDARSAAWPRMTGWERYTKELAQVLATDSSVTVRVSGSPKLASRLWQDGVATPRAVHGARVAHFPTFPPAPWARPQCTLVHTIHDITWWRWRETASRMGRHYYAPLARTAVRGGAHIVADSHAAAAEIMDHFSLDAESVTVVPLGVTLPVPAPVQRDRPYFLAVGTVEPRKNLGMLAEAYVRSGVSDTHDLVVVGRIGWGDLPPDVQVVSGLDDSAVAGMYVGATALVLPSLYEGFGLAAVEAMQLGTPVICSDIPVLREVTGGHATYVPPTDLDGWVEALRAGRQAEAPTGAADWSRDTYRWDVASAALSALYRRLDDHPEVG